MSRQRRRWTTSEQKRVINLGRCPLTGHARFATRKDAKTAGRHHGQSLSPFFCDEDNGGCGMWHAGRLPPSVKQGEVSRDTLAVALKACDPCGRRRIHDTPSDAKARRDTIHDDAPADRDWEIRVRPCPVGNGWHLHRKPLKRKDTPHYGDDEIRTVGTQVVGQGAFEGAAR